MKILNKLCYKNIRASSLNEFWGRKYDEDIYLWEGAKHNLTLSEIHKIKEQTFNDLFKTKEEHHNATKFCRDIYFKFLHILTTKLNEIHNLDFPVHFWQIAFGYWLFRYICILYEKYSYLSKFDIDKTSIKLLDKDSFFIPNDHYEFVYCFCNDFGVQQLVSQYYYLFKNKEFSILKKTYKLNIDNEMVHKSIIERRLSLKGYLSSAKTLFIKTLSEILPRLIKPKIVLLNASYSSNVSKQLLLKSKGRIQAIKLPKIKISQHQISKAKRQILLNINSDNDFEYYLVQTFYYCFPRIFIEQFRDYYESFLIDIQKRDFTHIVSGGWIGMNPVSLYFAIALNNEKKLICQEHAAGSKIVTNSTIWIDLSVANIFFTTGWKSREPKIIQGGFSCKNVTNYKFDQKKTNILFISHARFPYLMEFSSHASNSNYLLELKVIKKFINLLPIELRKNFYYRPRRAKYFWDTEFALEVETNKIMVDRGIFSKSILKSKIVIIDHISTGLAEILLMKAPFLLLLNPHVEIQEKYERIFDELVNCCVVHTTPESVIKHLSIIYSDVQKWWNCETVQTSINQLRSTFLAPPSKTTDYLLSCLNS